jgi:hypothetical protein
MALLELCPSPFRGEMELMALLPLVRVAMAKLLFFDLDEPLLLRALSLVPDPNPLPLALPVGLSLRPPTLNLLFTGFNRFPRVRQLAREVSARSRLCRRFRLASSGHGQLQSVGAGVGGSSSSHKAGSSESGTENTLTKLAPWTITGSAPLPFPPFPM